MYFNNKHFNTLKNFPNPPGDPKEVGYYYLPTPIVALDGYPKTCSRTCRDCNNDDDHASEYGWWQHKFRVSTTILWVEILACDDGRHKFLTRSIVNGLAVSRSREIVCLT